jgi:hypothetical protein
MDYNIQKYSSGFLKPASFLLLMLCGFAVAGQDATAEAEFQKSFTWDKIYKRKSFNGRLHYLDKYLFARTGDSAGYTTCMDKEPCIQVFLNLNGDNVALINDFAAIPAFVFKDSLKMVYLDYQNYCTAAKRIGDRIFQAMPTRKYPYKHIVLVLRAAAKEKMFYVDMEERNGEAVIVTADFLNNKHQMITWQETRYIYPSRNDPYAIPLIADKKKFSVGDRVCLAGHLFHPLNLVQLVAPSKDMKGAVFYRFYVNGYEKLSKKNKDTLKKNLPAAIAPYVFTDSAKAYRYFVLEFANAADSVVDRQVTASRGGGFKDMTTKQFLDFILPGLIRANTHDVIEYKNEKTLVIQFIADPDPYWNYDTERVYDDYLTVFLYDAKLRYQHAIKNIFVRFKHGDGSNSEFPHDLDAPGFREIYKRVYFQPIVSNSKPPSP